MKFTTTLFGLGYESIVQAFEYNIAILLDVAILTVLLGMVEKMYTNTIIYSFLTKSLFI